ncbi:MAG TPA: hypothetical protein VL326_11710 [Kofleriaceae bacterium]|nr:hypothetical protein [Kofleriaceae bacterium]
MTNIDLDTIPHELLSNAHGGAQVWQELSRFATSRGYTVTSTTGGHHLGWAHRAGHAVDVRTRGHSTADVNSFMRDARGAGITVIDERRGGNSAWSGPHLHLQR